MRNNLKYGIFAIVGLLVLLVIDFPISTDKIIGEYSNNDYYGYPFYAEIPYVKDTLGLYENGTFSSEYYNNGTYTIESGLFQNQLSITYDISSEIPKSILKYANDSEQAKVFCGTGGYTFKVTNKLFLGVRIHLVKDHNYYYSKNVN